MTDARALIPVVMGVGLAALTAHDTSSASVEQGRPRWREPLFILTTQLIGFAIVGVALFIAAWSVEKGHQMGPGDLRAENLLIVALGGLIVLVAVRRAWTGVVSSSGAAPWDRGLFDKVAMLLMLVIAVIVTAFLGMLLDWLLIGTSTLKIAIAVPIVVILLVGALAGTFFLFRHMVASGSPSPRVFSMSRRQQARMLRLLSDADGAWLPMSLRPIGELETDLPFLADVWQTAHEWYFRPDDAHAIARYHIWAADHLRTPVAAFHLQRISVFAGPKPLAMRGMRITRTTRRWWWLEAWRSHREEPSHALDERSLERQAGLVRISHHDLKAAGFVITVGDSAMRAERPNGPSIGGNGSHLPPPQPPVRRHDPAQGVHV